MALQELDIEIFYRPGKRNSNADALSRSPLLEVGADNAPYGIVSAVTVEGEEVPSGELATLQREDPQLMEFITFIETGTLPAEEKSARSLALSQSQYVIEYGVLYHIESDSTLRIIPPAALREQLFKQAHG